MFYGTVNIDFVAECDECGEMEEGRECESIDTAEDVATAMMVYDWWGRLEGNGWDFSQEDDVRCPSCPHKSKAIDNG